jgi:hypothetical protein
MSVAYLEVRKAPSKTHAAWCAPRAPRRREPLYVVRPRTVFGQIEKTFTKSATRWRFPA